MRMNLGALLAGLGLFCLTVPVAAHHGFDTEYDKDKVIICTCTSMSRMRAGR